MSAYGQRIKELRESVGIDIKDFAFRCDWSRTRLTNYETGQRKPGADEILTAAKQLEHRLGKGVAAYILTGEKSENDKSDSKRDLVSLLDANQKFYELIADAVDFGRMKLEPSLKVRNLCDMYSKSLFNDVGDIDSSSLKRIEQ